MNLYETLGVAADATEAEIRAAHRRKVLETHPDRDGGSPEAFTAVQHAYEVLSDADRRRRYDETGDDGQPKDAEREFMTRVLAEVDAIMMHAINGIDEKHTDVCAEALGLARAAQRKLEGQIDTVRTKIARARAMILRFKHNASGEDHVVAALNRKVAEGEATVAKAKDGLTILAKVEEIFAGYDYEWAPRPPVKGADVGVIWRMKDFDFFTRDGLS